MINSLELVLMFLRSLCESWWLIYKSYKIKIDFRHLKNNYCQNSASRSGRLGNVNQISYWELRKLNKNMKDIDVKSWENKAKKNHRAKNHNEDTWRTGCSIWKNSSPEARASSKRNRCNSEMLSRACENPRTGWQKSWVQDPPHKEIPGKHPILWTGSPKSHTPE